MHVCKIKLNNGMFALVEKIDYEDLVKHHWTAFKGTTTWYANTTINKKTITMHNYLLGCKNGEMADHKDGNGLNNTRDNLRRCTPSQNQHNSKVRVQEIPKTSEYKGVDYNKAAHKWRARIKLDGEQQHICLCNSEISAARAYNYMANKLFGDFARLNPIEWK